MTSHIFLCVLTVNERAGVVKVRLPADFSADASATVSDDPANAPNYSLDAAPTGMTIDASTGALSWTPTEARGAGDYPVTVKVTDNGSPALDDTQLISISVAKRPTALVYTGDAGEQYSDRQDLSAILTANGGGALQGSAVAGKTIGFATGSQNASGTTDNTGAAAATCSELRSGINRAACGTRRAGTASKPSSRCSAAAAWWFVNAPKTGIWGDSRRLKFQFNRSGGVIFQLRRFLFRLRLHLKRKPFLFPKSGTLQILPARLTVKRN